MKTTPLKKVVLALLFAALPCRAADPVPTRPALINTATGKLDAAVLPASVPSLAGTNGWQGTNTFNGPAILGTVYVNGILSDSSGGDFWSLAPDGHAFFSGQLIEFDQTGSIFANGAITAATFFGDGSHLTGLAASTGTFTGLRYGNAGSADTAATKAQIAAALGGGTGTLNLAGFTLGLTSAQIPAIPESGVTNLTGDLAGKAGLNSANVFSQVQTFPSIKLSGSANSGNQVLTLDNTGSVNGNATLPAALGGTGVNASSISQNQVFAGPPGSGAGSATPAFRALVAADIPAITEAQVSGLTADLAAKDPVEVVYGGTGGAMDLGAYPASKSVRVRLTSALTSTLTITLPQAAATREVRVDDLGNYSSPTYSVYVAAASGNTLNNGNTTPKVLSRNGSVSILSDGGTNWSTGQSYVFALQTLFLLSNGNNGIDLTPGSGKTYNHGNFILNSTNTVQWDQRSVITSPADGKVLFTNNAATGFTSLLLGGTTTAFPSIKANGAGVRIRTADDAADTPITASAFTIVPAISVAGSTGTKTLNSTSAGTLRLAAGQQTVVLTDNLIAPTTKFRSLQLQTDDATAKSVVPSVVGNGTATFKLNSAATGEVEVYFEIAN